MEADHNLTITGNLFVQGGGSPLVPTLGGWRVLAQYTVPVQAQGIATSGSSGPSVSEIASAVLASARVTPVHADIRRVNDVPVRGAGQPGNEWGPA